MNRINARVSGHKSIVGILLANYSSRYYRLLKQ